MTTDTVSLETIFLHVTKACNLGCVYCYFYANQPLPDELITIEFDPLWHDMVSISPKKVVFTGGEPLLRHDIFELLEGLRDADTDHRITRCLNTNGHKVTLEVAKRLVELVDEVRVSVDALADLNDKLRGEGNFASAMRAIDLLRMVGLEPRIQITLTRHTLPDLEGLLRLLISQGLTQINLNRFRPVGRGSDRLDWCVSESEVEAALAHAWQQLDPSNLPPSAKPKADSQRTCGVGRFLSIMPNGDLFPCHVLSSPEFRCGNLRTETLSSICASQGLIGRLSRLDFNHLKQVDPRLAGLTARGACMGEVYAQQKTSPAWNVAIGLPATSGSLPD